MRLAILTVVVCLSVTSAVAWAQDRGVIESPSATVSGIGFISGWKCNSNAIELWLTGADREGVLTLHPAQHMSRSDTAGVCLGEEDNGWIIQVNWNELIGYDTVVARDNGEAFASRRFTIGHTGLPFVQDKAGTEVEVVDFPSPGKATTLTWSTATQHFEVHGTHDINTCAGDACPPGSGEGDGEEEDEEDRPDPIGYYNGHSVYSEPSFSCDEEWLPVSVPNGWYCGDEEEYRIANSCQEASRAAWCTVSQTCTDEIQGEYATLRSRDHGGSHYSCYRVKTACLGQPDGYSILESVMHNGQQVNLNHACFSSAEWTNTYFDIVHVCDDSKTDQVCHDANGNVVWDSDSIEDHHILDNAVSCTWYCD